MRASPGRRQMRKFGPSAAMCRYTAGPTARQPVNQDGNVVNEAKKS